MKKFFKAKIEIIMFEEDDVIKTSDGDSKDPDMDESGWHLFG